MTPDDRRDVIFTGIGGQGVQLCSKVLANAAVAAGRHVMLSSYFGGEMRGGRTEATVITRDRPVDLPPIPPRLEALIVLHPEFLADALPRLVAAPLIVTDAWAWEDPSSPTPPARVVPVHAREIAADLGVPVAAGLALVGAFAALTGVADDESLATATRQLVPPHHAAALEANLAALSAGAEAVRGTPVGIGFVTARGTVIMALDRCKGCGLCVPVCRPGALEMTDERNAKGYVLPQLLDGCTGCRACAEVCPDFVFEVYRFDVVAPTADQLTAEVGG